MLTIRAGKSIYFQGKGLYDFGNTVALFFINFINNVDPQARAAGPCVFVVNPGTFIKTSSIFAGVSTPNEIFQPSEGGTIRAERSQFDVVSFTTNLLNSIPQPGNGVLGSLGSVGGTGL